MRRLLTSSAVLAVLVLAGARDASAEQYVNLLFGGFVPRSADSRADTSPGASREVLVNNLSTYTFDIRDFNGGTIGAEYLVEMGEKFEGSLGVSFYQRSVLTADQAYTYPSGADVTQELKLRIVPFTATVRWLPLGTHDLITPYIGAGVGIYNWQYSESGQFVTNDLKIISGNYSGSGSAKGPVILGGVRVPLGKWGMGGEIRYQNAVGDLPSDQGFDGTKIDLTGFSYQFTLQFRF